ncbi:growth hormone secretagogue receptor type 1-like [Glandiceps talaboti]
MFPMDSNITNESTISTLDYKLSNVTLTMATIAYTLIFLLGLVGNLLVLFVVCCNKDMRSSTNYFLVNLSVADLLVLVFCMPIALLETYVIRPWLLGETMCKVVPFLEYSAAQASVLTLVFISVERYVAICYPLKAKYTITPRRCIVLCVLIWLVACIASIPYVFMAQHTAYGYSVDGGLLYECGTYIQSLLAELYIISCFVVFFVFPLFILGVMYFKVAFTLRRSVSMIRSNGYETSSMGKRVLAIRNEEHPLQLYSLVAQDTDSGSDGTPQHCPHRRSNKNPYEAQQRSRGRVVYMLIAVVVTFFLCLLPQRIVSLWFQYGTAEQQMKLGIEGVYRLVISCRVLTYINSSANPIIYNIMSTKFRAAFLRALGFVKKLTKTETIISRSGSGSGTMGTAL